MITLGNLQWLTLEEPYPHTVKATRKIFSHTRARTSFIVRQINSIFQNDTHQRNLKNHEKHIPKWYQQGKIKISVLKTYSSLTKGLYLYQNNTKLG